MTNFLEIALPGDGFQKSLDRESQVMATLANSSAKRQ